MLPASFPNLQSLTLQACEMEDQTALPEKIAALTQALRSGCAETRVLSA